MRRRAWRTTWLVVAIATIVVAGALAWGVRSRLPWRQWAAAADLRRIVGWTAKTAPAEASAPPAAGAPATTDATPRVDVLLDPRRRQLIGVRMVAAKRTSMAPTIRAVGLVRYDETRLADINLKVEGWIRDLHVDYTGQFVNKGQPLFTLYSPELLTTQNEYLLALKTREQLAQSQIPDARERADQLIAAARQRLTLWDLPPEQLRALEETREAQTEVMFRSPVDGFVIEKQALQGLHVTVGQSLYKIADLSAVWVEADVYETEVARVHVGERAMVTLDAYPGERFGGRVIYIYPYVDEKTRTNKVRYEFANRGGRLKPGMYANVELSTAARVGVTVPTDAVLDSGKEQIVFVAQGDGYFEPRRVTIGRRLGTDIEILEGVKDGEQVAAGATFFLDSESQLRASLQGYEAPPASAAGGAERERLDITFRSQPDPPKSGENQFEVMVKDPAGKPVDEAQVAVQFFMAAMPTMNMPAMRNEVKLAAAGGGIYRGTGQVMTPGRWEVTVTVSRGGQRVGSKQLAIVSR